MRTALVCALLLATALSGCSSGPGMESLDAAGHAVRVHPEAATLRLDVGVSASFRGECTDPAGDLTGHAFTVRAPDGGTARPLNGTAQDGPTATHRLQVDQPGSWQVAWTCAYADRDDEVVWTVEATAAEVPDAEATGNSSDDVDDPDDGDAGHGGEPDDGSDPDGGSGGSDPGGDGGSDPDDGDDGSDGGSDPDGPATALTVTAAFANPEPCPSEEMLVSVHVQTDAGHPVEGAKVATYWDFSTRDAGSTGYTDAEGNVDLTRRLFNEPTDHEVVVDVVVTYTEGDQTLEATTSLSFTPKEC